MLTFYSLLIKFSVICTANLTVVPLPSHAAAAKTVKVTHLFRFANFIFWQCYCDANTANHIYSL